MKIITLIFLLMASIAVAQNVSRTELRNTNTVLNTRISTNATAVNARNAATESTNATQTSGINAANATNAVQTAQLNALNLFSVSVSNLMRMGITNIVAGSNAVIYTNLGTLVINGTGSGSGGSFATSGLPVIQVTNLLAENLDVDIFNVGLFIPTNTMYVTRTNTASSFVTNFILDFTYSEQTIIVAGAINFVNAINLVSAPTNAYLSVTLPNFSGSDQTLSLNSSWYRSLNFPTILTNRTITKLSINNYGGLSQSNILAGAAQFVKP